MLKTRKNKIVNLKGKPIMLKGVNVGGWLMMEAYFMHSPNTPERKFRKEFQRVNGKKALDDFDRLFRDNFLQESDFKKIASFGFNVVRVPFHYRLIETKPYKYSQKGVKYLDTVLRWAKKYKLYVILDLHAAQGCQNQDWHSDSYGEAKFWTNKSYQNRASAIWEFLADRYKDNAQVAGYDLLNEAVLKDARKLNRFYKDCIKRIRSVDRNHILFVEGNNWGMDLKYLDKFNDDNLALSIHTYEPLEFTFNLVPLLKYPLKNYGRKKRFKLLEKSKRIADKHGRPLFVGEFGVNYREGLYGEDRWLKDTLDCFKQFGFHWTYWPYKAMKNSSFPDGMLGYRENPPWVHREGPLTGWEMIPSLWRKHKNKMARSWRTENFVENKKVIKVLKNAAK